MGISRSGRGQPSISTMEKQYAFIDLEIIQYLVSEVSFDEHIKAQLLMS
jgi:hypothetical protein